MEVFDPIVQFLIFASEVTVSWDDVTQYLFYGLVTIAIWLIIKVFIEISEGRGKPKDTELCKVNTRRKLSTGSVETISELLKNGDGSLNRSAKSGARVTFDLTKNEDYVIEDVVTNGATQETDVMTSILVEENAEDEGGGEGEDTEVKEAEEVKLIEDANEEIPDEFSVSKSKSHVDRKKNISEDAMRKRINMEAIEINELEEYVDFESKIKITIEEVNTEVEMKVEMKGYDETLIIHERDPKELERPEDSEIGEVASNKGTEDEGTKANEQSFVHDIGEQKKIVRQTSDDYTVAVTKGDDLERGKDTEETRTKDVRVETEDEGCDGTCEKEIKYVTSTEKEWNGKLKRNGMVNFDDAEEVKAADEMEVEVPHRNENGYTVENFPQDVHEIGVIAEGEEIRRESEAEKTEPIEIDITQREEIGNFLSIGKNDGQEKSEIENGTEGISHGANGKMDSDSSKETSGEIPHRCARVELVTNESTEGKKTNETVAETEGLGLGITGEKDSNEDTSREVPYWCARVELVTNGTSTRKNEKEIETETEGLSLGVIGKDDSHSNMETSAEVPRWYTGVELVTNRGGSSDTAEFSTTKALVKKFESLREFNYERSPYVPSKPKRIRRHLSMPFVEGIESIRRAGQYDKEGMLRDAGVQGSGENGDVTGERIGERGVKTKVSPKEEDEVDTNKVPGCGVRVMRSRSLRDWKEDLKLSYKAGEWRLARGLPFYERFEDPDRERLIHETFGAILKPTLCHREVVPDDVISRSYSAEERNLLKNNCGQNGLKDWFSKVRLQDWKVAKDEDESKGFPKDREGKLAAEFEGNLSFFEATARNSRKEQEVDLISEGFIADFLDKEQPHILISEWVKVREHCKSTYELKVKLLDKKKETIKEFHKDLSFDVSSKAKWEKVSHIFNGYGPGVRYISFHHGAVKWSGMSGCRMSGAVVRVLNPT